jgi:hypothetical protein
MKKFRQHEEWRLNPCPFYEDSNLSEHSCFCIGECSSALISKIHAQWLQRMRCDANRDRSQESMRAQKQGNLGNRNHLGDWRTLELQEESSCQILAKLGFRVRDAVPNPFGIYRISKDLEIVGRFQTTKHGNQK